MILKKPVAKARPPASLSPLDFFLYPLGGTKHQAFQRFNGRKLDFGKVKLPRSEHISSAADIDISIGGNACGHH